MDEMKLNELRDKELNEVAGGASGSPKQLPAKSGCIVYKVSPGDNLNRISSTFNTTVKAIMSVNVGIISNPNSIRAGFYIYVPV